MKAYCYRSGQIEFGKKLPPGTLPIASSRSAKKLREIVSVNARHGYDGETLLVSGIPEARNDDEAFDAYRHFKELIEMRLAGKRGWPEPYSHANRHPV